MKIRISMENVREFFQRLNANYKPSQEKPLVKVAEAALFLPALGMYYLWEYFDNFNIRYFLYFDLKDAFEVLYESLMPIILIGAVLSIMLGMLVPDMLKRKNSNQEQNNSSEGQEPAEQSVSAISNLVAIAIAAAILLGFYILMESYQFQIKSIVVLLGIATLAAYLYFKGYRNLGFIVVVILLVSYTSIRARTDAQLAKVNRPTYDVILKNHSDTLLLKENSKSRYLIYKTSNYYFIKDEPQKKIFAYGISNDEVASFKSE
ncbi:MAG: hypothetical protein LBF27_06205 [Sphingobacterium sp.]|jgi:hypothetical protein|nr:hypothetical protein [Sphingobacterium sp.]